jgi:hypothetical protein
LFSWLNDWFWHFILKNAAKAESEDNELEQKRQQGKKLLYGQVVQVCLHYHCPQLNKLVLLDHTLRLLNFVLSSDSTSSDIHGQTTNIYSILISCLSTMGIWRLSKISGFLLVCVYLRPIFHQLNTWDLRLGLCNFFITSAHFQVWKR